MAGKRAGIVKEEQAEIEKRRGNGLAIDQKMLFNQVPTARAYHQHRRGLAQFVALAFRAGIGDRPGDRVLQIALAFDQIRPCRRIGIFEIGHEHRSARVQRIDDHLAVGGAGDLHAAVHKVGRKFRHLPERTADLGGFGGEIGQPAVIDLHLARAPGFEQLLAAGFEHPGQLHQELDGLGRQDTMLRIGGRGGDLDWFKWGGLGSAHRSYPLEAIVANAGQKRLFTSPNRTDRPAGTTPINNAFLRADQVCRSLCLSWARISSSRRFCGRPRT